MYVLSTAARKKRVANEIVERQREEGAAVNAGREDNPIGSAFIR